MKWINTVTLRLSNKLSSLTLSRRRSLPYRNKSIDLQSNQWTGFYMLMTCITNELNYQYVSFNISRVGFTLLLPQFREYCKNTISVERILSILKNNALIRDRFSIISFLIREKMEEFWNCPAVFVTQIFCSFPEGCSSIPTTTNTLRK